ncbi:MAG: hypothetical protein JW812_03345 [Alphaproteobacteria bacterium]|nr:hypothetical protein [Alphaproteobacteria bacterium]MBN2780122.1 hypothetical protein [Alphaproteobacteria bacterium]
MKYFIFLLSFFICQSGFAFDATYLSNKSGNVVKFDLSCDQPKLCKNVNIKLRDITLTKNKQAKDTVNRALSRARKITLVDCASRYICRIKYDGKDLGQELIRQGYAKEGR